MRRRARCRAYVLRSAMAHAGFRLGDLAEVAAMPGVRLILTHADLDGIGDVPCKAEVRQTDGTHQKTPPRPLLARDTVRYVGDPDRLRRRRRPGAGEGRGRGDRGRLRSAAGGGRHEAGAGSRRAAGLAAVRQQSSPSRSPAASATTPRPPLPRRRGCRASRSSTTASSPTTWRRAASSPNTMRPATAITLTMGTQGGHAHARHHRQGHPAGFRRARSA